MSSVPRRIEAHNGVSGQRFLVDLVADANDSCGRPARLSVSYYQPFPVLMLGDQVLMLVTLRALSSQSNHGQLPDQAHSAARGLHGRGIARQLKLVARAPQYAIASWRNTLLGELQTVDTPLRVKALMQALLLGVGHDVPLSDWHNFKVLGLAHVMVISGLHIGLVFVITRALLLAVLRSTPISSVAVDRLAILWALLATAAYAAVAGFSVSTVRALFMVLIIQLPRVLGWKTRPIWALLAALVGLLACNPLAALSSSLWLTVGATYCLLAVSAHWSERAWWLRVLGIQALMSALMAPLTAFWFGTVSLWGIMGNAVVTPLITLIGIPSLLAGAVQFWLMPDTTNSLWLWCSQVLRLALTLMETLVNNLPSESMIRVDLGLYHLGIVLVGWCCYLTLRRWALPIMFAALILIFLDLATSSAINHARLQVLDVGQGTAIVFSEGSTHLLYDTGAPYGPLATQASRVILPALRRRSVGTLKHMIVSHGDIDHSGGMADVLASVGVRSHWGYGGEPCRAGQRLAWPGDAVIHMLNGPGLGEGKSNALSCVLKIDYAGQTIVLAGDIEETTERELVRYWRGALNADVLAVAHHGSSTSSTWSWLKWVEPSVAIISAGYDNRFGHPHDDVMDRLTRLDAKVLDTRIDGGIEIDLQPNGAMAIRTNRGTNTPFWARIP